jgi:predicted phosphate transport protein (TIGR00153 family)
MTEKYGVLAYDIASDGDPRFLLITSRETKRWVIPRGNAVPGLPPHQSAAQEAYEEAGLTGLVEAQEIGTYLFDKRRKDGSTEVANVHVFPLRTTIQSGEWPERKERDTRWFTRDEAAAAVDEPGLKTLIRNFIPPAEAAARLPVASLSTPPSPPASIGFFRLFKSIMPKEDSFFDLFARHAETVVGGADAMSAMFSGEAAIEESCRRIADYEHQADAITRDVLHAVRRSFITPFDRSAITSLISSMDDTIDEMHQTAKAISRYEVSAFEPPMHEMAALSAQAARLVVEAVPLLRSVGKNGGRLDRITENIVHLEGAADDLHEDGLKALFKAHGDSKPMAFFVGREIYSHLERVLDGFEDVANEIQGVVIDHA